MAAYNNTFNGVLSAFIMTYRSGSGVVFSNTLNGTSSGIVGMYDYRVTDAFAPWQQANGTNGWDTNYTTLYDSGTHNGTNGGKVLIDTTKTWTANQWVGYSVQNLTQNPSSQTFAFEAISSTVNTITPNANLTFGTDAILWTNGDAYAIRKVYKSIDQPGAGISHHINISTPGPVFSPVAWPNQADEAIYYWSNTGNNATIAGPQNYTIISGRDYSNAPMPGYTALAYPHPFIALTLAPTTPKTLMIGPVKLSGSIILK